LVTYKTHGTWKSHLGADSSRQKNTKERTVKEEKNDKREKKGRQSSLSGKEMKNNVRTEMGKALRTQPESKPTSQRQGQGTV